MKSEAKSLLSSIYKKLAENEDEKAEEEEEIE